MTFIVFEGIDGAGTTTQTRLLCDALFDAKQFVHETCEPSHGPIGDLLRQMLKSRVEYSMETMALLFAADRMDHIHKFIKPALDNGMIVVSDRYVYSSIGYQTLTGDNLNDRGWIECMNSRILKEDLTIVLDVPYEVARERIEQRDQSPQRYDNEDLQSQLVRFYRLLPIHFGNRNIVMIDGIGSKEEVHKRCRDTVFRLLGIEQLREEQCNECKMQ